MAAKSLTWKQVNAWRLAQHYLAAPGKRKDLVKILAQLGGVQAQVMSAAELALAVRLDGLPPQQVQTALWRERSIVKTWAMRGTLHLVAASELPLYAAARSLQELRSLRTYFNYFGIAQKKVDAYLDAAPEILTAKPMTREEFAAKMAARLNTPKFLDALLYSGWGTPLKPLAWRGDLCFGPNRGQKVTFVNGRKWIGKWKRREPYAALQEVLRRYLRAYGPSRAVDFALWWGFSLRQTRKLFDSLEDELLQVDVDGWRALALQTTIEAMQDSTTRNKVNLVPLFDMYVMALGRGAELEPHLPKRYHKRVYRPQGWISAAVLVDGVIQGIWEYQAQNTQTVIKVQMFTALMAEVRKGIEAEAERLGRFLNSKVELIYETTPI